MRDSRQHKTRQARSQPPGTEEAADLDDEKIDDVEDVYFDWTHEFMSATR
ncbi:MAG: hypothetical protein FWD11_02010 [Micrococcales bacterium]|nr:hypothetical protein [Micrococcales bacterium]